jgi:hypothetical protein
LSLDVAYVGNHGVASIVSFNMNAATVAGLGNAGLPQYRFNGRSASSVLLFAPYSSMYNALQVKLDRRFSSFHMTNAFTWGKGQSFGTTDDNNLLFYSDQQRNYSRNDYDRKYTFVHSSVYELPFGPGKRFLRSGFLGTLFGNWQMNAVLTAMSGTPFTLTASSTSLNAPGNTQTVNQIAPVQILKGIGPKSPWFDPSSFAQPSGNGVFGTTGRNILSGPGFFNLDASLFKIINLKERYKIELRGEAFGLTNTAHFANPGSSYTSNSTFGYVTGTLANDGGGRVLQLGAKLSF